MTKVKFELECLKKLLKRDSIVKIVNELPDKETADLNYIYIIPKEGEGKDKKAYVLRPDRSGFDIIDLTPQLVNVLGKGHISVEKEVLNENGDVTFTVTTSSSFQEVLDSLTAKDKELDTKASTLEAKNNALTTRVNVLEENKPIVENKLNEIEAKNSAQDEQITALGLKVEGNKSSQDTKNTELEGKITALESKVDKDSQTLALDDHTLSISEGNSVTLPKYDDSSLKASLQELKSKNTEQDEGIKTLQEKTKSFLTGAGVTRQGNVVTLTYTNIDGSSTNLEFNDNDTKAIAYDDTALKARVQELENKTGNDTSIKERLNALESKEDKNTLYSLKSTTDGLTVVKSQENGEEVFTINADLAFKKYYTKGEIDKAIADNNKRTQTLTKYSAIWKVPDAFKYTNDGRTPVLSYNNVTSFGNMKLDGMFLKPIPYNTIICEFPPNTPKPVEFIELQTYIGDEYISMWYSNRVVRVTEVPKSLVGKRIIFNFVGLFA